MELEWVESVRALKGKSDISRWDRVFSSSPSGAGYIQVVLDRGGREPLFYSIPIPSNLDDEIMDIVARYLAVFINNRVVKWSARRVGIRTENQELVSKVTQYFEEEYGYYGDKHVSLREMMARYYRQDEPLIIERLGQEGSFYKQVVPTESGELLQRSHALSTPTGLRTILGINIGKSKTRIGLVRFNKAGDAVLHDDNLVDIDTWPLTDNGSGVVQLFDRIEQHARELITDSQLTINNVGIAISASAEDGKALDIPLGLVKNFSPDDVELWINMDSNFSARFGNVPVVIENDAVAQAIYNFKSEGKGNLLVIRFGTSLSSSYVDKEGRVPDGFNQLGKVIIDMYDSTPTDGYYRRRAANYISYRGIVHISKMLGLFEKYNLDESNVVAELRNMIQNGTEEEMADVQRVYQEIGHRTVEFFGEVLKDYEIETLLIEEGTVLSGRPMEAIEQAVRDEISRDLRLDHIKIIVIHSNASKAGGVIGAAYRALESELEKTVPTKLADRSRKSKIEENPILFNGARLFREDILIDEEGLGDIETQVKGLFLNEVPVIIVYSRGQRAAIERLLTTSKEVIYIVIDDLQEERVRLQFIEMLNLYGNQFRLPQDVLQDFEQAEKHLYAS